MQLNLFLLLDGGQRLGNDVRRGFAKTPLAGAAKVVRRLKQAKQHAGLLLQRGLRTEVITGQIGKAKLFVRRKLPRHFQLDGLAHGLRGSDELRRRGLVKLQQHGGGLHLDPLATVQLHLRRRFSFREHPAGQKLSGFFKQ